MSEKEAVTQKLANEKIEKDKEVVDAGEIMNDVVSEQKIEESVEIEVSETLNMPVNTVKMLAYATGIIPMVGWLSGLLVLLLEKDTRVKLHAYHGLVVFGGLDVVMLLIMNLTILGKLSPIVFLVRFVLWLYIMVKVSEGKDWLLPYVGPWAKKQIEIIKKGSKKN